MDDKNVSNIIQQIDSSDQRKAEALRVHIGIIGTGRIAPRFLEEAKQVSGVAVTSAYNPQREQAETFEAKYGIRCYYNDLEDFLAMVDAVYIASPHETHYKYARAALKCSKHVLCEKPLAFTATEARDLFKLAKQQDLVLMEGIKTAYGPGFAKLMEVVKSGIIGEIGDVEACFSRLTDPSLREMTDVEYGGAYLEFGSYTLLPIFRLLGIDYEQINIASIIADHQIDLYTKIHFKYKNGMASSKTGIGVKSEGQLMIAGTKGYILVDAPWWLTKAFEVRYEDPRKIDRYEIDFVGDGLRYEINEYRDRILGKEPCTHGLTTEETIAMAAVVQSFMEKRKADREDLQRRNIQAGMKVWAHRGCSYRFPENTLPAFQAACELDGITGVELDIQLTRDGELVVFHDEAVDRLMDGAGHLKDYSLSEIRKLRFKGVEDSLSEVSIPTMEEVLRLIKPYCVSKGLLINIELKNNKARYDGMEEKILELISDNDMGQYVLYSSFNGDSLVRLKELDEQIKAGILKRKLDDCISFGMQHSIDAYHPCIDYLEGNLTLSENAVVRGWNEREPFYGQEMILPIFDLVALRKKGVTDLITNVPERYLE